MGVYRIRFRYPQSSRMHGRGDGGGGGRGRRWRRRRTSDAMDAADHGNANALSGAEGNMFLRVGSDARGKPARDRFKLATGIVVSARMVHTKHALTTPLHTAPYPFPRLRRAAPPTRVVPSRPVRPDRTLVSCRSFATAPRCAPSPPQSRV